MSKVDGGSSSGLFDHATIGVEEEFLLVESGTGMVSPLGPAVLNTIPGDVFQYFQPEFHATQMETASPVCGTLDELRKSLLTLRQVAGQAAARLGSQPLAVGTSPLSIQVPSPISPILRYAHMADSFGAVADTPGLCGCHVHVQVPDRATAVAVCNHLRPWLPVLQAMTANSPYFGGRDTRYASWRAVLWSRWPSTGPAPYLDDLDEYEYRVRELTRSGAILDEGMVYWYSRPSTRYPTVEVRIGDVCLTVADTILVAGLVRALVTTVLEDVRCGVPPLRPAPDVLVAAHWRAARDGLEDSLYDPGGNVELPAWELVDRLVCKVRPALESAGDVACIEAGLSWLRHTGTGAARQRRRYAQTGDLRDVVRYLAEQTVSTDLAC
jgi:carboxylate-amine ligase